MAGRWFIPIISAEGRVAIVTGANSGIGYETAIGLAERGAHVILACRNMDAAEEAAQRIRKCTRNPNVTCLHLDLSVQQSVHQFATDFMQTNKRLDILVNNAGVMAVPWQLTADGFETHMGINHFGHFSLTLLLLPTLQRTPNSRVVNVSSLGHRWVRLPYDLNTNKNGYNRFSAYAHSKLANAMFTRELARRLGRMGVTVNCLHPGVIHTNIPQYMSELSSIFHR